MDQPNQTRTSPIGLLHDLITDRNCQPNSILVAVDKVEQLEIGERHPPHPAHRRNSSQLAIIHVHLHIVLQEGTEETPGETRWAEENKLIH
jgi:hypothetical protein